MYVSAERGSRGTRIGGRKKAIGRLPTRVRGRGGMSLIENNKAIARRWFALISEHRPAEICQMTAATWTMHGGPPLLSPGPDGVRELFQHIGPIEQEWTVEDVIAEGDQVAVEHRHSARYLFTGLLTGRLSRHGETRTISGGFCSSGHGLNQQRTISNSVDTGSSFRSQSKPNYEGHKSV
jgi:hypothetical protein